jgi:ParB family transcriptional regulator, chromosome partitioning protein
MSTIAKHATAATKKSKPVDHTSDRKLPDDTHAVGLITGAKPSSIKIVRVRIGDIAMPNKWRSIQPDKVDALAASMKLIGLRTPISVRYIKAGVQLVAGRHRLEAAIKLGWKRIDAIVMRDDKFDRRIWHNTENIERAELTVLERAEAVAQRAKDVSEKAAQSAQRGGRQPHDKGVSKAAKVLGVSRDSVRRSKKIAAISPEAKAAAVKAGLDNEKALLKVANEKTQKDQIRKVCDLTKPKGKPKLEFSEKERKQFNRLKRTFAEATDHRRAWDRACKLVRDRFIARIRKQAPSE